MTDLKSNCCCGTGNVCPTHGGSDTPRTDMWVKDYYMKYGLGTSVDASLARTLERELAAANGLIDLLANLRCEKCGHHASPDDVCGHCLNAVSERELAAMTKERDAEKAQHQDTLNRFNSTLLRQSSLVEQVDSLCEERDTLRARVAELESQKEVACVHEWYLGRCVHCDRPVKEIKK